MRPLPSLALALTVTVCVGASAAPAASAEGGIDVEVDPGLAAQVDVEWGGPTITAPGGPSIASEPNELEPVTFEIHAVIADVGSPGVPAR